MSDLHFFPFFFSLAAPQVAGMLAQWPLAAKEVRPLQLVNTRFHASNTLRKDLCFRRFWR